MATTTTSPIARPLSNRMGQLDGLRALAVFLTFITHFTHSKEGFIRLISSERPGSRLFFILSGFLITGLLLRYREDVNRWGVVGRFHLRRFLRTLPLYYLLLIAATVMNLGHAREGFWWHASFLSNIYFDVYNPPFSPVSHFWSLAVQEQFYLLWPFLVLFLPRRFLFPAMLTSFLLGPLSRLVFVVFGLGQLASSLPLGCLDTLAGGAMLAVAADRSAGDPKLRKTLVSWSLRIGLPAVVLLVILNARHSEHIAFWIFSDTALGLVFIWLVDAAARSIRGPVGRVLDANFTQHIGRVSYGIYILHPFMPSVLFHILKVLKVEWSDDSFIWFATLAAMSIAAGSLSWRFVESPINAFRIKFPYATARKNQLEGRQDAALQGPALESAS